MLLKVAADDIISFKNNNAWLNHHPAKARIFAEPEIVWEVLKEAYQGDFKNLVFGHFPPEAEVLATLKRIQQRLLAIEWAKKTE
jgi:hypothetical protein